jgi:hypothetical protein
MMPGPLMIYGCPQCGTEVMQDSLSSGNTFGARVWSDCYMDAPMLPEYAEVTKCAGCERYFWLEDATIVREVFAFGPEADDLRRSETVKYARQLTQQQLTALLRDEEHTAERERYLRLRLWWKGNDAERKGRNWQRSEEEQKQYLKNLVRLHALCQPVSPENVLLVCALLRAMKKNQLMLITARSIPMEFDPRLQQLVDHALRKDNQLFEFRMAYVDLIAETFVTGLSYHDYADASALDKLYISPGLQLRREPKNPHDRNAIAVLDDAGGMIGYIPRDGNTNPARLMDDGKELRPYIIRIDPKAEEWYRIKIAVVAEEY